jgi:hypothetical protein
LLLTTDDPTTPQKLAQARKIFEGLQHGKIDRSLLTDNLNSYWKLGEATGATRSDSVGTNHLASVNAVALNASGIQGGCASFTAASAMQLNIADNASLSTGDIDFSFACWVFTATFGSFGTMASKGWDSVAGGQREWILYVDTSVGNKPFFGIDNGTVNGGVTSTVGLSTSTWYLIACWHDSVNNLIGVSVNTTATTTTHSTGAQDGTAQFHIGSSSSTHNIYWNGRIDEAAFWKRVLTAGDLTELYNGGLGLTYPFPVTGHPTMRRWGGIPQMLGGRLLGRTW